MTVFNNDYGWIIQKRKGDSNDPFSSISEQITVINGKAFTREVINEFNGIIISDGTKTFFVKKNGIPDTDNVVINYGNGVIYFDAQYNNKQYTATYKGEGTYFINAKRVASIVAGDGSITETLDNKLTTIDSKITDSTNKITEINSKITEANTVIVNTNTAKDAANSAATSATNAANSAKIRWLAYVANYAAIATTYPTPTEGDVTQTIDTGDRYRFTSGQWVAYEKILAVTGANTVIGNVQPSQIDVVWIDTSV